MRLILLIIIFTIIMSLLWKSKFTFSGKFILLFTTIWFLDMFLVAIDASQVGGVKLSVLLLVLFSVVAFIVGFCIKRKRDINIEYSHTIIDKRINELFNYKVINIIYIALLGYVLLNLIYVLPILLAAGNMGGGLRVDSLTGNLYPPIFYLLNNYILSPIYNITLPLMAYLFISGKHKFSFVITLLYCILYPSLFGGRMQFFIMGLIIMLCYLWIISCKTNYIRKGFNRLVALMASGIVILFVIMSIAKSGDITNVEQSFEDLKEDLIKQPLEYFSCPVKAFEYAIDHDYPQKMGGYMYGRATLAATDYYINPIINKLSGSREPNVNSVIGYVIQDEWISFSKEVDTWNALYTALLHFYLDFGWIGCIILSFVFGLIASKICTMVVQTGSIPLFVLLFYILSKCILSVISYFPVGGDVIPLIIYLLIWRRIEKIRIIQIKIL